MSKETALILRGVAILLMLWGHLFYLTENVNLCDCYIYIKQIPLVQLVCRATNPVPIFIILSGYGLFISHRRGKYNVWSKLISLFFHYWITLIIFVGIGCFLSKEKYPGSLSDVVNNVTAWHTTYNSEIWFLFPYAMVMLTSKWIVKVLDRYNPWLCLGATFFLSLCTGFVISRYGSYLYGNILLHKFILYCQFLFAFTIGAYMAKYNDLWFNGLKAKDVTWGGNSDGTLTPLRINLRLRVNGLWIWIFLIALVVFRCCFKTGAFHTLYAAAFIVLFVNAPRPKGLDSFLMEMGKRSTSMWFVHTYFCYYIFHDWIYGFRYPTLIFIVLLACSYGSAVVIDWINKSIQGLIKHV